MRLGIMMSFQCRADLGDTWEAAYRDGLALAAEASRLGIDDIWVSEHHGEEDGYCPSPVVAGAALAAAAPACRIGQGIAISPLYGHPLRLAEDLSVLDNISGGRAEIGFGQGYRRAEFEAYGLNYGTRTRAFEESLDILRLAWTGERFDYDGAIYRTRNGLLRPAPVQRARLPLWIGAAAPVSRARAVRHGAGLMIASLTELGHTARQFEAFDQETKAQGRPRLPHALAREILVGDSAEEAVARHQVYLDHTYRVQYAPERTGMTYRDPSTGERRPLTSDNPYFMSVPYMRDRWFVGTPEEVATSIVEWQRRMSLDVLLFHPKMPGMPLKQAVEEMERVTRQVMPLVRRKLAA